MMLKRNCTINTLRKGFKPTSNRGQFLSTVTEIMDTTNGKQKPAVEEKHSKKMAKKLEFLPLQWH